MANKNLNINSETKGANMTEIPIRDINAARALEMHPTPPIKPAIAAGTSHGNLGERMKVVVEDGKLVQQAMDARAQEVRRLDAIEVEQKLRAQREVEAREKLERVTK